MNDTTGYRDLGFRAASPSHWLSNLTGGVCSTSVGYDDTDEQYEVAHTKFSEIGEKFARSVAEAGERMLVEAYEHG